MAGYQIYIPGVRGADPEHLRRVGLAGILDPKLGIDSVDVLSNGPDGGWGVCFYWPGCPRFGVHKKHQEWSPAKPDGELPAGRFWMGRDNDAPVTPEALLRPDHLGGKSVQLDDGREWLIPVARSLPHRYGKDEQGRIARIVKHDYRSFYDRALHFYERFLALSVGGEDITLTDAWGFAVEALSMNYRLDENIIDWLGLLTDDNIVLLIGATFEFTTICALDVQKKTGEPTTLAI